MRVGRQKLRDTAITDLPKCLGCGFRMREGEKSENGYCQVCLREKNEYSFTVQIMLKSIITSDPSVDKLRRSILEKMVKADMLDCERQCSIVIYPTKVAEAMKKERERRARDETY